MPFPASHTTPISHKFDMKGDKTLQKLEIILMKLLIFLKKIIFELEQANENFHWLIFHLKQNDAY